MSSSRMFIYGFSLTGLAFFLMVIAFSSPNWLESFEQANNKFVKLGLWETCFNDYTFYQDYQGKRYKGCWYIFSYEYRPIWEWLSPPWFISVQVMISLTFLLQGLVAVFLLCMLIHCCPIHVKPLILTLSSIVMFLCGLLITISLIVFGVKSEDRQWMPRPDQNYLSWSFGICVLSGFFSLFSAMCLLVASISSSRDQNVDSKAHRMRRY
ncbi:XP_029635853.1uncharacterized protein LOC115211099 isoform X2 [Octopus vulgaris]|uniref:XP_029635853.1uncharacterized protein LOC115211099 isoform X2 n=1 Tax=Octopus vulgaris TaxID=6645 RepID=A0AA36F1D6_OCTVU|nr:XP_029635853.1uncharacterized protein LOC115211099 isoform X2 [Octopus vulgaris]